MKVIKSGNANANSYTKECTCLKCKAVLLVGLNDVYKRTHQYDFHVRSIYSLYFSCPKCFEENLLSDFEVPSFFYYS